MLRKLIALAVLCVAGMVSLPASAQFLNPDTPLCNGAPCFTAGNPGTVSGSFSATLSGFTPGGTFATLTATNTAGTVALPAGTVVAFQNTGTTTVSCTVNVGAAAVANQIQVPASSTVFITVGANTSGSCIDQTGSTSNLVVLAGGSGLGTGFGGGGGGGGSSGAVFGPTAVGSSSVQPPVMVGGTQDGTQTGTVAAWKVLSGAGWMNAAQWNGVALGSPSAYGTSPGAVNVPGVNAFITNTPTIIQGNAGSNAQAWWAQIGDTTHGPVTVKPANVPSVAGDTSFVVQENPESQLSTAVGTTTDAVATVPASGSAASSISLSKATLNTMNTALGAPGATACTSDTASCNQNQQMQRIAQNLTTLNTTAGQPGTLSSQYPSGAVPLTASATGTTAATTATLAGTTGKTTYICGYSIRANATANTNVTDTITGVVTGIMSSALWVPANTAGLGVDETPFSPCVPASATNTAIAVVSGAPGSGGVVTVRAWGYQL